MVSKWIGKRGGHVQRLLITADDMLRKLVKNYADTEVNRPRADTKLWSCSGKKEFDLMLDVMIPGIDGFETLREGLSDCKSAVRTV